MGATEDSAMARFEDLDLFRLRIAGALSPHTLRKSSSDGLDARFWSYRLGGLRLVQFRSGTALEALIPEQLEYFDFIIARSGGAAMRVDGRDHSVVSLRTGVVLPPGATVEMRLGGDFEQLHLRVAPDALEQRFEQLAGRPAARRPSFSDLTVDIERGAASWTRALEGIVDDRMSGQPMHPLLTRGWEETLLTSLLLGTRNSLADALAGAPPSPARRSLRLAVDYIDAHLGDSLSPGDVAAVVGMSERSLQRGFREQFETTPMRYIEERRLAAVRDELSAPGPATTVGETAYRWGFSHLPRFAAAYLRRYGERPSETLARAR